MREAQYKLVWIILLVLYLLVLNEYFCNERISGFPRTGQEQRLAGKINPNLAGWSSLARLPGIGEVRAKAIIAYREEKKKQGEAIVFTCGKDLMQVKGIGKVTAAKIQEYIDCGHE